MSPFFDWLAHCYCGFLAVCSVRTGPVIECNYVSYLFHKGALYIESFCRFWSIKQSHATGLNTHILCVKTARAYVYHICYNSYSALIGSRQYRTCTA